MAGGNGEPRPIGRRSAAATNAPTLGLAARGGGGPIASVWRQFRRNRLSLVALGAFILIVAFSFGAPLLARYVTNQDYAQQNLLATFAPPGASRPPALRIGAAPAAPATETMHILGTDELGRDVLTRLAYGGRISLSVAFLTAALALTVGLTIGMVAGFFGGWVDSVLMRAVDVMLTIPGLFLLILVSSLLNNNAAIVESDIYRRHGWLMLPVVIALLSWPTISRLIRGECLALKEREYVEAARVLGASDARIILRHILPNTIPIVVVWISLAIPGLILTEAALSYLGFGVQIPTPSWGNMLTKATQYVSRAPYLVIAPGLAIFLTVLSVNLIGNGLRDALDPRLRHEA